MSTSSVGTVVSTTPSASQSVSIGKLAMATTKAAGLDNSKKIIIIYQKSSISSAVKKALSTCPNNVHFWDPIVDASLDAPAFAQASYNILILWAGDPNNKNAATAVHTWYTNNRAYIKQTGIVGFVIPKKLFSAAGLKSVYEDAFQALKAIPKWAPNLEHLLLNFEEEFPSSEYSIIKALFNKFISAITKKG